MLQFQHNSDLADRCTFQLHQRDNSNQLSKISNCLRYSSLLNYYNYQLDTVFQYKQN